MGSSADWRQRYGKANEHNALVPRDHWIEAWERRAIIEFFDRHPLEGYRRLTFMMLDENVVVVSPATTYRVLSHAGLLDRWNQRLSKNGTGFVRPEQPHQHWHVDLSYLNLGGTFYYLCSILDGTSRARRALGDPESRKERDVLLISQTKLASDELSQAVPNLGVPRHGSPAAVGGVGVASCRAPWRSK